MHQFKLLFLAVSIFCLPAIAQAAPPGGMPPSPVEIVKPQQQTVSHGTVATGELKAIRSVTLKSEVPGKVAKLNLAEGQLTDKGTLLVELDEGVAKSTLNQMQAKYDNSQIRYKRMQILKEKGSTSTSEFDEALSNLRFDEASLSLAKAHYEKTQIRAPFTGILGLKQVNVGEYIDPGQPLITLTDIGTLYVDFSLPEKYLTQVKEGQIVEINLDSIGQRQFQGKIYAIAPHVDQNTHTVHARAAVMNSQGLLRPGLFAKVKVIFQTNTAALTLPEQAVFNVKNQHFLYRIVDGKAALTEVKVGLRENGKVEIVSGIKAGDSIAKSGHMKLYDGAQILDVEQMKNMQQPGKAA